MSDTPIFNQLTKEFNRAGRSLPWSHLITLKPYDTVYIMQDTSTGIHPPYSPTYIRNLWVGISSRAKNKSIYIEHLRREGWID